MLQRGSEYLILNFYVLFILKFLNKYNKIQFPSCFNKSLSHNLPSRFPLLDVPQDFSFRRTRQRERLGGFQTKLRFSLSFGSWHQGRTKTVGGPGPHFCGGPGTTFWRGGPFSNSNRSYKLQYNKIKTLNHWCSPKNPFYMREKEEITNALYTNLKCLSRLRAEASPDGGPKRQTILTITFCSAIWRNFLIETCYTN